MTDRSFLQGLYAQGRAAEVARLPWPPFQKAAFLDDQFRLQHLHFSLNHPAADFWIIEQRGRPVGRLYLDRSTPTWRLIEIALADPARGQGVGAALIGWVQTLAQRAKAEAVDLYVLTDNTAARRLYARLGFAADGPVEAGRQRLLWRPLLRA